MEIVNVYNPFIDLKLDEYYTLDPLNYVEIQELYSGISSAFEKLTLKEKIVILKFIDSGYDYFSKMQTLEENEAVEKQVLRLYHEWCLEYQMLYQ